MLIFYLAPQSKASNSGMSVENSPSFVTSEDENESSLGFQKRKADNNSERQKLPDMQSKKRFRSGTGSGINLVSYALDNDDGDSDSEIEGSGLRGSDSSTGSDTENIDVSAIGGTLHFGAPDGGPLTVLSSAHIEAAQDSPATLPEETHGGVEDQPQKDQPSYHSSPSNVTGYNQSLEVALPPEPKELCSMQLQNTVENTLRRMQHDIGFDPNSVIQDNKAFRNPSIYKKLISFLDIDEKGTNFSSDVFNPYRWDANSFYDKLGEIQNREVERLDKLQKERRKAEASSAAGANPVTGLQRAASGPNIVTGSTTGTNAAGPAPSIEKRSEIRKRSKWDTVAPMEPSQPSLKVAAPQVADPMAPKVTIPAIGDLFHKK
ncbi:SAP30-binding protein [Taenia crassiceps]|uniref:SAP30-binding protein n=1 Tax=Taenia crassiceps TaxID=6207 RepID=A0ABR4QRA0_9CEST